MQLEGKKYGLLTAVKRIFPNNSSGSARWLFLCDCGKYKELVGSEVTRGTTKSCGHLQADLRKTYQLGKSGSLSGKWKGHGEISGHFWSTIKNNAANRNLDMSLTIEQAWQKFCDQDRKCALSGVELTFNGTVRKTDGTASLDRIDSTQPYTYENTQWVHKDINRMKQNFSQAYFIDMCRKVVNHA